MFDFLNILFVMLNFYGCCHLVSLHNHMPYDKLKIYLNINFCFKNNRSWLSCYNTIFVGWINPILSGFMRIL